jgi:hypothetical protein
MEERFPPTPGNRGCSERLVRHVTQAHPNDLVDPWWMDQALSRDYGEFIYRQWVVDIAVACVMRTPRRLVGGVFSEPPDHTVSGPFRRLPTG